MPEETADGPNLELLSSVRVRQVEYGDGSCDVERDDWRTAVRGGPIRGKDQWRGITWFYLREADTEAGVPRKRFRGKQPLRGEYTETDISLAHCTWALG